MYTDNEIQTPKPRVEPYPEGGLLANIVAGLVQVEHQVLADEPVPLVALQRELLGPGTVQQSRVTNGVPPWGEHGGAVRREEQWSTHLAECIDYVMGTPLPAPTEKHNETSSRHASHPNNLSSKTERPRGDKPTG